MKSARENVIKALDGRPILYRRARGQSVDVPHPALSFWGTLNIEPLRMAASDEDLSGGLFSGILFCAPDYSFVIPRMREGDPALFDALLKTLRQWRSKERGIATFEPGVEERLVEYGYTIAPFSRGQAIDLTQPEDQVAAITSVRYPAIAQKVAMLLASSECPDFGAALRVTGRPKSIGAQLKEAPCPQ